MSRYIIGIDLGTTNTAAAYVDTRSADQRVRVFEVPQLTGPGEVQARKQLPSFIYLSSEHDLSEAETKLPWDDRRRMVVGELARGQGARVASRMISSAKSWLCHAGVDRHAQILPWGSETQPKLSPVGASAVILRHVQEAWDHVMENEDDSFFADQEVMVTVPASFDEAARELTLDAATSAGMEGIVLLEEPQAAFYAWIESHALGARARSLSPGDRILVFDVGGGTTDFTLIEVGADGDSFERTAVGDHLLLGGDNIDLTLAKQVEGRLGNDNKKLDTLQWHGLVHACRLAKESILSDSEVKEVPIAVGGRGSKLIGGTLKSVLNRDEVEQTILGGFFPEVVRSDEPKAKRSGLQEFGLPYAADPAITRQLAGFLNRQGVDRVAAVLFNGGAMTPASLRKRVLDQIGAWQEITPRELSNELPELAVAKGAAYYGLVRRGLGSRIRGGTPRSFYVGVGARDGEELAVCLAPKGLEEGSVETLERNFELVTNRPVSFKLFSSSSRRDAPGALVPVGDGLAETADDENDLLELPPIVTVLRAPGRGHATVELEVRITELGALEIYCIDQQPGPNGNHERWRLAFDMRAGGAARENDQGAGGELDPRVPEAQALIKEVYGQGATELEPSQLMKKLEAALEARRDEWSMSTTRALFDAALEVEDGRTRSAEHEARWFHLTGFCLRPGTGAPLDQWRVKQMWRLFNQGLSYEKHEQCRLAWWIVWRRIAGGLTNGQQEQIYDRLAQLFIPSKLQKKKWYKVKPTKQEAAEMWRILANLERLPPEAKALLGDELARRMESKKGLSEPLHFWAMGRLGARAPLYGPLNTVVPPGHVAQWLEQLLDADWPEPDKAAFPVAQLGRKTGDRARDIDDGLRERLASKLRELPGGDRTARLVEEVVALEAREERVALGDTLPAGLRLA